MLDSVQVIGPSPLGLTVDNDVRNISLPEWKEPSGQKRTVLKLGFGLTDRAGWGNYSPNERAFFNEVLPSIFNRTLVIDSITGDRGIKWIFTGPREGFYIELSGNKLLFYRKYYDSFGYNHQKEELPSYPQFKNGRAEIEADKPTKAITVEVDYKLALRVSIGGQLHYTLDNWDSLQHAKAHYYGDNFTNGEVSDCEFNRKIQELGDFVMFDFWDFTQWIANSEKEYARVIVGYCREADKRTVKAPRIVGVQNEVDMPEGNIKRFVSKYNIL
jgi:hypothetical protein